MCDCPEQSEVQQTMVLQRNFSDSILQSLSAEQGSLHQKTIYWHDALSDIFATEAKQQSSSYETYQNESLQEIDQPSKFIPRLASNLKCRIQYFCRCIGIFFNRLMKFSPKIIEFFTGPVLLLWSGDQSKNEFDAIDLYDYEVIHSQAQLEGTSSFEAQQSSQKSVPQSNEPTNSTVSSVSLQITQTLQIPQNPLPNEPNQIFPQQDLQNKQEQYLAQKLQKLEKTYTESNFVFLKEVEQIIIKAEKELQLLICLKYFMTQCKYCKYRNKLGFQCHCQYDNRNIEIKKNYLQRLYKHRHLLQLYQKERKLKNSQISMENKCVENVAAELSSSQCASSQPLVEIQPYQTACNQLNVPAPKKETVNNENQKKNSRYEREAIRNRSDWTSKKITRGREKVKRDRCNYSEQEVNLHNFLDQLHLNEGYRVSCNVEEGNIKRWKEMSEKQKKRDIKTLQKQGTKRTQLLD